MGLTKKFLLDGALVLVSVACMLLAAEFVLRFTSYAKLLPFSGIPTGYYVADKNAGYDIAVNFATSTHRFANGSYPIWSNNLGCFDAQYNDEQPYIYLAGDSFTWGFTPFADKWGTQLQSLLGVRIVKCGVPGTGTKQQLAKATKILATLPKPSRIILGYFANDPDDDAAFPNSLVYQGQLIKNLSNDPTLTYDELEQRLPQYAQWAQEYCMWNMPAHPALQAVKCYLRNHSILYLMAQSTIKTIVPRSFLQHFGIVNQEPPTPQSTDGNIASHLSNLGGFKALASKEGASLLVVLIPPKEDVYSSATSTTYAKEKEYMDKNHISYFDPLNDLRKMAAATTTSFYWPDDPHLDVAGNHALGLVVGQYILSRSTTGR